MDAFSLLDDLSLISDHTETWKTFLSVMKVLETFNSNFQENIQFLNLNTSNLSDYEKLNDEQKAKLFLEIFRPSGLILIFTFVIYYLLIRASCCIAGLTRKKSQDATDKVLILKKTRLKVSKEGQKTWKTMFSNHLNEIAVIVALIMIFKFHFVKHIQDWILLGSEMKCFNGIVMPTEECIPKITELIIMIQKKKEDVPSYTEVLERYKYGQELIEFKESTIELIRNFEQILVKTEDSAKTFQRIHTDNEMRVVALGISLVFQLTSLFCSYMFLKKLKMNGISLSNVQVILIAVGLMLSLVSVYMDYFIPMLVVNIHKDSSILIGSLSLFYPFSFVKVILDTLMSVINSVIPLILLASVITPLAVCSLHYLLQELLTSKFYDDDDNLVQSFQ